MDPEKVAAFLGDEIQEEGDNESDNDDSFERFLPLLAEISDNIGDILELSDELSEEILFDLDISLSDSDNDSIEDGFTSLPKSFQKEAMQLLRDASIEEIEGMADYLEQNGITDEKGRVFGYLYRLSEVLSSADYEEEGSEDDYEEETEGEEEE